MCRILGAVLVAAFVAGGCSYPASEPTFAIYPPNDVPPTVSLAYVRAQGYEDVVIAEPVVWRNLTVFPVVSKEPKDDDRLLTLEQGLAEGSVTIQGPKRAVNTTSLATLVPVPDEYALPSYRQPSNDPCCCGDGSSEEPPMPDYNQMLVYNRSNLPLYLMTGEVISTGSQDRIVGQDLIIHPARRGSLIDVSPSDAETADLANGSEQLAQFAQAFDAVAGREQIVGVAVAVNGCMVTADVFASTPLFRKLWPKLLQKYALDALASTTDDGEESGAVAACTVDDCRAFLNESREMEALADENADEQPLDLTADEDDNDDYLHAMAGDLHEGEFAE